MRAHPFLAALLVLLPELGVRMAQAQPPAVVTEPPGRKCGPADIPDELPTGNQLVDSVALSRLLGSPGRLLLSLRIEDAGQRATIRVLESDRDPAVTELLRGGIQQAIRLPQAGIPPVWAIRLRVIGAPAPALTLEPSVFCPATPRGGSPSGIVTVLMPVDTAAIEDSAMKKARPERRRVRLTGVLQISPQGEVTEITLTESSGQPDGDEEFAKRWRRLRFFPALLDGFPVAVSYDTDTERSTPR